MLTPQARELLESVVGALSQPDAYPDTASIDDQDAWVRRDEAESALAGLISTRLADSRVDRSTLEQTRALVQIGGTRADSDKVAAVLEVLAQEA